MSIKIKIALAKEELSPNELFKEGNNLNNKLREIDDEEFVFHNSESVKSFNDPVKTTLLDKKVLKQYHKEVVVIFRMIVISDKNRWLLIYSGDIRKDIDTYKLVSNFGIKLGINFNEGDLKIKDLTKKSMVDGDNTRINKNQFTGLKSFDFSGVSEFLKSLKIKMKFPWLEKTLYVPLNHSMELTFNNESKRDDILLKCTKFVDSYYSNDSYIDKFDFIDNYFPIDNTLNDKLFERLWESGIENAVISWPTFENESHNHYTIDGTDEKFEVLDSEVISLKLKEKGNKFKNIKIHSMNESDYEIDSKPLSKCISTEIRHEEQTYVLQEGKWLMIDDDFLKIINKKYSGLKSDSYREEMLKWKFKQSESEYNEMQAKEKDVVLLDRELINFDRYNKMELADLCYKNRDLIAVKKYKNGTSISHLIQQVINSVEALQYSKKKIQDKLVDKKIKIDLEKIQRFVLAIASKESINNVLPKVAFFSKASITSFFEKFSKRISGLEMKIKWIKLEDET